MDEEMKYRRSDEDRIDELFRKAMNGHQVEPDPRLWKGISRKLLWLEIRHFNFTNLSLRFWVTGIVVGMLTGTGLYVALPGSHSSGPSGNRATIPVKTVASVQNTASLPIVMKKDMGTMTKVLELPKTNEAVDFGSSIDTRNNKQKKNAMAVVAVNSELESDQKLAAESYEISRATNVNYKSLNDNPTDLEPTLNQPVEADQVGGISFMETEKIDHLQPTDGYDTIVVLHTVMGDEKFAVKKSKVDQIISASLGVSPEVAFYSGADSYQKMNYYFSAGVTWNISRFSISSGLGLGYMFDYGKYDVEYKSKDSVGYFTNVISYTTGSNNEIKYSTQYFTLYDSLQHQDDYRTSDRYTYLRIPFMLGYRLIESQKISLTLQAGPAISFLLGSRKSDPVIEYDNARIIRIDDETPVRLNTNWQFWANLNIEIFINRKISLYFEPTYKYYLNPTAEQENSAATPPWSLGLGVGLKFNFEPKRESP